MSGDYGRSLKIIDMLVNECRMCSLVENRQNLSDMAFCVFFKVIIIKYLLRMQIILLQWLVINLEETYLVPMDI